MASFYKVIKNLNKNNIISYLKQLESEYRSTNQQEDFIKSMKEEITYLLSFVEQKLTDNLEKNTNIFFITVDDYWVLICWYLLGTTYKTFESVVSGLIDRLENEWLDTKCFNLSGAKINNIIDIANKKFDLLNTLKNSESIFYFFNIPFKNKYEEDYTSVLTADDRCIYLFELFGDDKDIFLEYSFAYSLGQSLYFYIKEKDESLITKFSKEFDIKGDVVVSFSEAFSIALLYFTEYDSEVFDIVKKEKYTRFFENVFKKLHNTKEISENDPCPCGSSKKYKNCCMKKDLKWITDNNVVKKQLHINKEASTIFESISSSFAEKLGRNPYSYEKVMSFINPSISFESVFSDFVDDNNFDLSIIYASIKTGMIVSEINYNSFSDLDILEWEDAIDEFNKINEDKKFNGKSIFEYVHDTNKKLDMIDEYITNINFILSMYLNNNISEFLYDYSNVNVETKDDFSIVCCKKILIDSQILLSAFSHKSVEEATNITRIIYEDLIQLEIFLENDDLFNKKIKPLALLEKGLLQYKKNSQGKNSKNIFINPITKEEYNTKINIKDLSLKSKFYGDFYDNIFDGLSSFIHLNVFKTPKYFKKSNPLTEVQEYKTVSLLALFFLNQCIFEMKKNTSIDSLLLRDTQYMYHKVSIYIDECIEQLLTKEVDNEIYIQMKSIIKECLKNLNINNIIDLTKLK